MKFSGSFIKANNEICDFDNHVNAPYFRKEFKLDFAPDKAEITICGLGFYELYVNGKNITKGPLAPYISNCDDICYYDNYDIADMLNKGDNVLAVLLGNGFRNPYGGFMGDFEKAHFRGSVTFALSFEAESGDDKLFFEADTSFKTHPSPIVYDDIRMGYRYDARLEMSGWCDVDFDDSQWSYAIVEKTPKGTPRLCQADPIVVTDELTAENITHYDSLPYCRDLFDSELKPIEDSVKENVYVYDFGINSAGVTKLKINGKPGQIITLRHSDYLYKGEFSVNTIMCQRDSGMKDYLYRHFGQTDVFICKGGYEEFVPKFKYDGFRYVYVEGLEVEQATKDAITYLVMNSDIKERGSFSCSDKVLNQIQECTRRSDLSNFYYFPTDCPHREKNGWTADAWLSAEHMMLNLTPEKSFAEWMHNIAAAQRIDGALPGIVPTGGWGFEWGNGPVWDSVCVQIPYAVYKYTGDSDIIKDNASLILRYLHYISANRDSKGLTGFGLGDWCDPYMFEKMQGPLAPLDVVATIASYDIARKAEFLLNEICMYEESGYARALAEGLRKSFRDELIDFNTMTVFGSCQTSQTLAIAMGLFDEDEKSAACEKLLEIIHNDGDKNRCGVYGIRYIFHVLADIGEADLAYKIITDKEIGSYGYWMANGATTLWEDFRDVDDPRAGSRNHHFFGDVSSWFIQRVAGLMPNPDCNDITYYRIAPSILSSLDYAEAKYNEVYVKWERTEDTICLYIKAPEGSHGDIVVPDGYTTEGDICWSCDDGDCELNITLSKA